MLSVDSIRSLFLFDPFFSFLSCSLSGLYSSSSCSGTSVKISSKTLSSPSFSSRLSAAIAPLLFPLLPPPPSPLRRDSRGGPSRGSTSTGTSVSPYAGLRASHLGLHHSPFATHPFSPRFFPFSFPSLHSSLRRPRPSLAAVLARSRGQSARPLPLSRPQPKTGGGGERELGCGAPTCAGAQKRRRPPGLIPA